MSRTVRERTAANNFVVRFLNFAKKQKIRLVGERPVAARNDVTAKKVVSGLFQKPLADGPKTRLLAAHAISNVLTVWPLKSLNHKREP